MKTPALAAALAAALTLSACGSDGDGARSSAQDAPAATQSQAPETVVLDEAQLEQGLATLSDLPTGYVLDTEKDDEDTEVEGETPECTEAFRKLDEEDDDAAATAEVEFTNEQTGFASLSHSWESYEDADQLQTDLDELIELFTTCDTMILPLDDPEGTKLELQVKQAAFPELGDASAAYSATGEAEIQGTPFTFSLFFAFVRDGGNAMTVLQGGLGQADTALVEKIARLGVERLPAD